jgi:hypothetical protein
MFKKLLVVLVILLFIFVIPTSALINVTAITKTSSEIVWTWNTGLNITSVSVDGSQVALIDKNSSTFILSGLKPLETHIIMVYSLSDVGINTTNTTAGIPTNQENFFGTILPYLLFILGAFFCVIGFYGVPLISLIGSVIGLFGLVNNSTNGSFIIDVLYVILMIAGIILVKGEI